MPTVREEGKSVQIDERCSVEEETKEEGMRERKFRKGCSTNCLCLTPLGAVERRGAFVVVVGGSRVVIVKGRF